MKQILHCYKEEVLEEFLEHSPDPDFYPIYWISKIVFRDYLLEEDDVEIPHPVLIQKFGPIAKKMADVGVLVRYFEHNHSDISLVLHLEDGSVSFFCLNIFSFALLFSLSQVEEIHVASSTRYIIPARRARGRQRKREGRSGYFGSLSSLRSSLQICGIEFHQQPSSQFLDPR